MLNFGSFQGQKFGFEDFLRFAQQLPRSPLVITSLDAMMLAPPELSLALAFCGNLVLNNRIMRDAAPQRLVTAPDMHAAVNSALLQYT